MTSSPFCINPRLPTSVYYIPGHCSFKTKQNEWNNLAGIERRIFLRPQKELNGYMGIMETSKSPGPGLETWTIDEFDVLMTHMRSTNHTPNHHWP
jgi:hypothetical protein